MNPGTIVIILIGIVTFLLYLSKALKPSIKEKFQVLGDDDIKYKASGNIPEMAKNAKNFNKMISALKTPEFLNDRLTSQFKPATPNIPIVAKTPNKLNIQQMKQIIPVTNSNVGQTLPANTPASILNIEPKLPQKSPEPVESKTKLIPEEKHDDEVEGYSEEEELEQEPKVKTKIVYVNTKCPPPPDMSQYIRKDSIPCWGCNLR
jgi:hypothetical protein